MDRLRERFLRLSRLQKTLVFGGLGLASGWVTTIVIWLAIRGGPVLLVIPALLVGPGLFLGQIVLTPLVILAQSPSLRRTQPLVSGSAIHLLAMLPFGLLLSLDLRQEHVAWMVDEVAAVAGCLEGFLLGAVYLQPSTPRNLRVHWLTTLNMGCAAGLGVWWNQRLVQLSVVAASGSRKLAILWLIALIFVTLHVTAAVCLSLREWPATKDEVAD